jgi:hypothetical protein
MHRNKERFKDRVCIITFEDLIGKTESVMRYLAEFLAIEFDECLLMPTFNKYPIKANTSFDAQQHGIMNSTLDRHKSLTKEDADLIKRLTAELHREVLNLAVHI